MTDEDKWLGKITPKKPKSSKKLLWVILIVLILLGIVAVIAQVVNDASTIELQLNDGRQLFCNTSPINSDVCRFPKNYIDCDNVDYESCLEFWDADWSKDSVIVCPDDFQVKRLDSEGCKTSELSNRAGSVIPEFNFNVKYEGKAYNCQHDYTAFNYEDFFSDICFREEFALFVPWTQYRVWFANDRSYLCDYSNDRWIENLCTEVKQIEVGR